MFTCMGATCEIFLGGENVRFAILGEISVEAGNAFEKDSKAVEFFARYLENLKPEAAYFSSSRRYVIVIANAESHEELLRQLEPLWHTFKTYPQVDPIMNLKEFKTIMPKLSELTKGL